MIPDIFYNITFNEILMQQEQYTAAGGLPARTVESGGAEDVFDIVRYLNILFIHKWKFLLILLLVLALAVCYGLFQPRFYRASYDLYYTESAQRFVAEQSDVPVLKSDFDKHYWLRVMQSKEVARRTAGNSGLSLSERAISSAIAVSLETGRDLSSPIYRISITHQQPEYIPILLKAFVQALNDLLVKQQVDFSQNLVNYLSGQLSENFDHLASYDREILMQQAINPYLVRDMSRLATNLESFRSSLQHATIELASLRASRQRTELELQQLDPTIFNELAYSEPLKIQLMNLQVDLARALTRNQEDHPRVKALRDNIVQINNMIRDSLEHTTQIRSIMQNPLEKQLMAKLLDFHISEIAAETRIHSLQRVIADIEGQMLPDTLYIHQKALVRNRERVLMTIDKLNSKLIDVQSATHGGLYSFIYIDQPAVPEHPANRALLFFVALGMMAGLGLGAASIYLYDLLDNRIMLAGDFQSLYKLPVAGMLPHDNHQLVPKDHYPVRTEAAELVFNIRQLLGQKGGRSLLVCSPLRNEGKTRTSLKLALGLAAKNMKVLLIDFDLLAPGLARQLGINGSPVSSPRDKDGVLREDQLLHNIQGQRRGECLLSVLRGTATPQQGVGNSGIPNLWFMTAERPLPGGSNSMNCEEQPLRELLAWACQNYDAVILDTPALLYFPDMVCLAAMTDMVLPVVRLRHSRRASFDKMLGMLGQLQKKIPGVVINDLRKTPLGNYETYENYYAYEK